MIIVKLAGGLGNQLFQFAFARAIATQRNDMIYVDLSFLKERKPNITHRDFKLHQLNNFRYADRTVLEKFKTLSEKGKTFTISDAFPKEMITSLIHDQDIKAIFIDGFFQDHFYFLEQEESIKHELRTFLSSYDQHLEMNEEHMTNIHRMTETVAIHIRRTDYLQPAKLLFHGICDDAYYSEAVSVMKSKLINPHFFIFSDDAEQADQICTALLDHQTNVSTIINRYPFEEKDLIELFIMSQCKNFIIANSSYSWWGSYLSNEPNKLIIAPKRWYADEYHNQLSNGLSSTSWLRI